MRSGTIVNGAVLTGETFENAPLAFHAGEIAGEGAEPRGVRLDATGLLVLPGIVDIHGDAFERQIMPRPGVGFPVEVALLETDRQLAANGITTAFHSVTWSWEPGLRDRRMAAQLATALDTLDGRLAVDTRFHLRHETHNLDAEAEILDWIAAGRIDALSFNNHIEDIKVDLDRPMKKQAYLDRTGLTSEAWHDLVADVAGRADEVPASIERLAAAARGMALPMLSHDDVSPEARDWFQTRGVTISEFPETIPTAERAKAHQNAIVFGAPNVVRGGSHTGAPDAASMVAAGLCSVLASDYYYPALTLAPFALAKKGIGDVARNWDLVSANPAAALGLDDRGRLTPGMRADIVLVDASAPVARVVATIVAGEIVHLAEGARLASA